MQLGPQTSSLAWSWVSSKRSMPPASSPALLVVEEGKRVVDGRTWPTVSRTSPPFGWDWNSNPWSMKYPFTWLLRRTPLGYVHRAPLTERCVISYFHMGNEYNYWCVFQYCIGQVNEKSANSSLVIFGSSTVISTVISALEKLTSGVFKNQAIVRSVWKLFRQDPHQTHNTLCHREAVLTKARTIGFFQEKNEKLLSGRSCEKCLIDNKFSKYSKLAAPRQQAV